MCPAMPIGFTTMPTWEYMYSCTHVLSMDGVHVCIVAFHEFPLLGINLSYNIKCCYLYVVFGAFLLVLTNIIHIT